MNSVQHVFIVGAKSLGAYGGYETFVNKLTEYHSKCKNIRYHVACKSGGYGCMDETLLKGIERISNSEFIYNNAHCFKIDVPDIGSARAIYYDVAALDYCCRYIKKHNIEKPIVYILACRIGMFIPYFKQKIQKLGGRLFLNPDGHEWKRSKWSAPIKLYWRFSERLMVKYSDLIICDSKAIEEYIKNTYKSYKPCTAFIAYGAETRKSFLNNNDEKLISWYGKNDLLPQKYYLMVGRFVPENNYETIIKEYMKSDSKKDLVIIADENAGFYKQLEDKLKFTSDKRIKFTGTVYDRELLMKIREGACGYIHGHEVGGTNPSLLEALGRTSLNLILDVPFNREVAEDSALYWKKEEGSLSGLINRAELIPQEEIDDFAIKAKHRIEKYYSWNYISDKYAEVFIN